jgi:uncharacterized membrane protein
LLNRLKSTCSASARAVKVESECIACLVLWIVLIVKAFQGVRFKLPLAGEIAESLAGRAA